MKRLIIIGAGGFGREIAEWATASADHGKHWTISGFVDDADVKTLAGTLRYPILARAYEYEPRGEDVFICAIGTPAMRRMLHQRYESLGAQFVSIIHPTAIVCSSTRIECGAIVCPFSLVSADAHIGTGSVIYYHTSVDHDVIVGNYTQVSGHCDITGGVILGNEVFVGSHAVVLPKVVIRDRAIIGAGAVVTKDVAAGETVFGVPARRAASLRTRVKHD